MFSDHEHLVYAPTLSESQRLKRWQVLLEEFGPNIQHISGFDNIVADMFNELTSTSSDKYKPCTRKDQCCTNKVSAIGRLKDNEDCFLLNILMVQEKPKKN